MAKQAKQAKQAKSKAKKGSWTFRLWVEGELLAEQVIEGVTWEAAKAEASLHAASEPTERPIEIEVVPSGLLYESRPRVWRVDEDEGVLVPYSSSSLVDPLPHAAVRVFGTEDAPGTVRVVLERGLQRSHVVVGIVGAVVKKHLGSSKRVTMEATVAAQKELEDQLARLAARRVISVENDGERRAWR